ncbi:MAG: hypothetical protein RL238_1913 [Actinomycetota bacterium]|jgi:predicted enzyme related to lactoylglutathione lyase
MPAPRITTVIINAEQPERLISFWCAVFQTEVAVQDAGITWLARQAEGAVGFGIQQVDRKRGTHTETHLDIEVDDLDVAQQQVEALGGSLLAVRRLPDGFEWRVMADPDGNEFCLFTH